MTENQRFMAVIWFIALIGIGLMAWAWWGGA